MPLDNPLRILDQHEGYGSAWDGDTRVAEVHYRLKEIEEQLLMFDGTVPQTREAGQRALCGIVRTTLAPSLARYIGVRLTLQMEDGRHLPFTIAKHLSRTTCLVQALGRPT